MMSTEWIRWNGMVIPSGCSEHRTSTERCFT